MHVTLMLIFDEGVATRLARALIVHHVDLKRKRCRRRMKRLP